MKNKILIIIINLLFIAELYLFISYFGVKPSITGNVIISTNGSNEIIYEDLYNYSYGNFSNFEFSARFSDNIINHDSWHMGGFSNTALFDENDKAVFYVDVGVITPYLQVNNTKYWCKSLIKDWTNYHLFKINVDNSTVFYIDEEKICEFNITPRKGLNTAIGEKDRRGNLVMYVMDVKSY